jgi:hypothetical protein
MNLYLNYAREHWANPDENPPIGLILCSENDTAVAHYALGNLVNHVLARDYQLALSTEEQLVRRMEARRRQLDSKLLKAVRYNAEGQDDAYRACQSHR